MLIPPHFGGIVGATTGVVVGETTWVEDGEVTGVEDGAPRYGHSILGRLDITTTMM